MDEWTIEGASVWLVIIFLNYFCKMRHRYLITCVCFFVVNFLLIFFSYFIFHLQLLLNRICLMTINHVAMSYFFNSLQRPLEIVVKVEQRVVVCDRALNIFVEFLKCWQLLFLKPLKIYFISTTFCMKDITYKFFPSKLFRFEPKT